MKDVICSSFRFAMLRKLIIIFTIWAIPCQLTAQLACGKDIDLNTWVREGSETDGTWTVSAAGNSVEQSINGEPTFFVSPDTFINVIMEGKIKVNTANDDDLVGFVFGYKNPTGMVDPSKMNVQTYVFDWKQSEQTDQGGRSQEGYALYKVDGIVDYTDYVGSSGPVFWARDNTPVSTLMATNYGNNGWNDFQEYTFRLQYTAWNVTIWIDGVEVINVDDCYEPGRFGFYNSSQNFVIYSDFTYQYIADFDVVNPDICVSDTGYFEVGFDDCPYSDFYPAGTTFEWDYGDGQTGSGMSSKHKFDDPKSYDVVLTVTDPLGCADTSVHPILVSWLSVSAVDSAALCDGESQLLKATTDGAIGYVWGDGSTDSTLLVSKSGNYVVEIEDSLGCKGFDTIIVDVAPIPEIELGKSIHLCLGDSTEIGKEIHGVEYNWSTGEKTSKILVNESDTYWVEIESSKGCVNGDTIDVHISGPSISLPEDIKVCSGSGPVKITSDASNYMDIIWSTGETSSEIYSTKSETIIAVVVDGLNCMASDTISIHYEDVPLAVLPPDTQLCAGENLLLSNNELNTQNTWNGPGVVNNNSLSVLVNQTGEYTLSVESDLGCSGKDTIEVEFVDIPTIDLGLDTVMCFRTGEHFQRIAATTGTQLLWSTGETSNYVEVNGPGVYSLTAQNEAGCETSDQFTVTNFCPYTIFFPNAFTPNNDGVNDYFPTPNDNLEGYQLFIFNRWGQMLFEGNPSNPVWDGTYMGLDCQMDVYVWKAIWEFREEDGSIGSASKVGHVSLLR